MGRRGIQRDIAARGTNQHPWRFPLAYDAAKTLAETNLGMIKGVSDATPLTPFSVTGYTDATIPRLPGSSVYAAAKLKPSDVCELKFYGVSYTAPSTLASSATRTAKAYLWAVHESERFAGGDPVYDVQYVGYLTLTVIAALGVATPWALPTQTRACKIVVTDDVAASPGIKLIGKADTGIQSIRFDHGGATDILVGFEVPAASHATDYFGFAVREY